MSKNMQTRVSVAHVSRLAAYFQHFPDGRTGVKDVRSQDIFSYFYFVFCFFFVRRWFLVSLQHPPGRGISHRSRDGSHVALADEFVSDSCGW